MSDSIKPVFQHDCDACVFLGHFVGDKEFGAADLYYCPQDLFGPTVVARYGNEGPEYGSGLCFADMRLVYNEAARRAVLKGLLLQSHESVGSGHRTVRQLIESLVPPNQESAEAIRQFLSDTKGRQS